MLGNDIDRVVDLDRPIIQLEPRIRFLQNEPDSEVVDLFHPLNPLLKRRRKKQRGAIGQQHFNRENDVAGIERFTVAPRDIRPQPKRPHIERLIGRHAERKPRLDLVVLSIEHEQRLDHRLMKPLILTRPRNKRVPQIRRDHTALEIEDDGLPPLRIHRLHGRRTSNKAHRQHKRNKEPPYAH